MRLALVSAVVSVLVAATGCTDLGATEGGKEYVSGDGTVLTFGADNRPPPVEAAGADLEGQPIDLADYRGQVLVVNVWGAWCTECRAEQPLLNEFAAELPDGVAVIGINVRDPSPETAMSYVRTFEVPYPSIYDQGSEQLLRFPDPVNPRAIPSTIVLDVEGRVASVIVGQVPSKLTLLQVVEDVLDG